MLCMGGYMAGSGVAKIFGDRSFYRSRRFDDIDYNDDSRADKRNGDDGAELLGDA